MSYTEDFYVEESKVATDSANVVLPIILNRTSAMSVIDVGSGTGAWAACAADLGCVVKAVDQGVPEYLQLIPVQEADLTDGYDCKGWDLAICLEVAEHLPPESGPWLVAGLVQARSVLFSAATPGQPGVNHINCQPHDYWHDLFAQHGMTPWRYEFTAPVADFYCRNIYLYERTQ